MSHSYDELRSLSDDELIKAHDDRSQDSGTPAEARGVASPPEFGAQPARLMAPSAAAPAAIPKNDLLFKTSPIASSFGRPCLARLCFAPDGTPEQEAQRFPLPKRML